MLNISTVYTIIDEFEVKGKEMFGKMIGLDKKILFDDFNASEIKVDGESYKFSLTHNETWIIVQTDNQLLGKKLIFIK